MQDIRNQVCQQQEVRIHQLIEGYTACYKLLRESTRRWSERRSKIKDRKKASEAAALLGQLHNIKFLLRISGLADIYNLYGKIINLLQTTNLLPHERFSKFKTEVQKMKHMSESINHELSCYPGKCQWPHYHSATGSLNENSEICGILVIHENENRTAIGAKTRGHTAAEEENNRTDTNKPVKTKLKDLAQHLSTQLREEVFTEEEQEVMATCKTLCNLADLLKATKSDGPTKVAACQSHQYIAGIRKLPVQSLKCVPDECLKEQFQLLLKRLNKVDADKQQTQLISYIMSREWKKCKKEELKLPTKVKLRDYIATAWEDGFHL